MRKTFLTSILNFKKKKKYFVLTTKMYNAGIESKFYEKTPVHGREQTRRICRKLTTKRWRTPSRLLIKQEKKRDTSERTPRNLA